MIAIKRTVTSGFFIGELALRANLLIIFIGSYLLTNRVLEPVKDGVLILALYCLIDIWLISVVAKRYENSNIARDYNELSCYGLIVHLIAIPGYIYGIPSQYHNYTMQILMCAYAVRLLYFGKEKDGDFGGLPTFGLFAIVQKNLRARSKTALSALMFLCSALPIWYIIAKGDDNFIIGSVIAGMTYAFVIPNCINNVVLSLVLAVVATVNLIKLLPPLPVPKPMTVKLSCTGTNIKLSQGGSLLNGIHYEITGGKGIDSPDELKCVVTPSDAK